MIEKQNMKELTMDFTLFQNMQFNGLINLKLAMNIFFQKFKSNLNSLVSLISQELTKTNMNLFLTFGMKEEKFISIKSKKSSNIEWTKLPNSKKKNKLLLE